MFVITGFLGNRTLLKISKTFKEHSQWKSLANKLLISQENIEDISNNDDECSTCTFKVGLRNLIKANMVINLAMELLDFSLFSKGTML